MRFDVPTIGMITLETMVAAGAGCWPWRPAAPSSSIEQVVDFANRHHLAIVALAAGPEISDS